MKPTLHEIAVVVPESFAKEMIRILMDNGIKWCGNETDYEYTCNASLDYTRNGLCGFAIYRGWEFYFMMADRPPGDVEVIGLNELIGLLDQRS